MTEARQRGGRRRRSHSTRTAPLFADVEDYPYVRSSEDFQELQDRSANLEERIAGRRELYHESVAIFNARIK